MATNGLGMSAPYGQFQNLKNISQRIRRCFNQDFKSYISLAN